MAKKGHGKPAESEVEAIAGRLRAVRSAAAIVHGITDQAEFADRAGIARNTYNQWEQAKGAPSRLEVRKLKKEYGITLDYVFEGDPSGLPHAIARNLRHVTETAEAPPQKPAKRA